MIVMKEFQTEKCTGLGRFVHCGRDHLRRTPVSALWCTQLFAPR